MERLDDELKERRDYLETLIRDRRKKLQKAPEGKLRISRSNGYIQYYWRKTPGERGGRYLRKGEKKLVQELAEKEYDEHLIQSAERELHAIDRYLHLCPKERIEQIYDYCHPELRKLVIPVRESDEEYVKSWLAVEYQKKEVPEATGFRTGRGELVRSKSEWIIANLLEQKGVPYRYEAPVYVEKLGIVHPDFTVLKVSERREYLWEHLGMMDDSTYSKRALYKLRCYELDGYFLGGRLLLTYETLEQPLNTQQVEQLIAHYLL